MTLFFLQLQCRRLLRYFKTRTAAKIITTILFVGVFLSVAVGIYQFFLRGFMYLQSFPYFETAILLYSFQMFFLLLSFLAWFGSMISLLFGLFKSKSQLLYLISPRFMVVPRSVLSGTFISAAWMFLFLMLPALLATSVVFHLGMGMLALVTLAALMMLAIVVLFAYCCVMVGAHVLRTVQPQWLLFSNLSVFVGILVACGFVFIGSKFSHQDILVTLSVQDLLLTKAPLEPIFSQFQWLPTSLAAGVIAFGQQGNASAVLANVGKLLGVLVVLGGVALLASRNFLLLWQRLAEGHHAIFQATIIMANTKSKLAGVELSRVPLPNGGFNAVLYKEIILLFRNTKNLFWLLFLGLLWLSYIGFNFTLQKHLAQNQLTIPGLPKIILAMQLMVLVYFVSAMVLRFAFPSLSAERNTVWIFSSSPLSFKKLLWAKFLFFSAVFGLFSVGVELCNVFILHLQLGSGGMFLWLSLCSALFISALGLYFGARFPNFQTDDPQSLGTSMPGLVFIFTSILYGALGTFFYYTYVTANNSMLANAFAIFSVVLSFALIQNAAHSIEKIDFVPQR